MELPAFRLPRFFNPFVSIQGKTLSIQVNNVARLNQTSNFKKLNLVDYCTFVVFFYSVVLIRTGEGNLDVGH